MGIRSARQRAAIALTTLFVLSLAGNVAICLAGSVTSEGLADTAAYPWLLAHCALLGAWVGVSDGWRMAKVPIILAAIGLLALAHSRYWFLAITWAPWTAFDWINYFAACRAAAVLLVGVWVALVLAVAGLCFSPQLVVSDRWTDLADAPFVDQTRPRPQFTLRSVLTAVSLVAVALSAVYSVPPYATWIHEFPSQWWKAMGMYGLIHVPSGILAICLLAACIHEFLLRRFRPWFLLTPFAIALVGSVVQMGYSGAMWPTLADEIEFHQCLSSNLLLALLIALPLLIVRALGFRLAPQN